MKKIVHIIHGDKFTNGYINFMNEKITLFEHVYFYVNNEKYDINTDKNIIRLNKIYDILKFKNYLEESDLIIASGIFDVHKVSMLLSKKILNKMLLQFWGGDFYIYRNTSILSRMYLDKLKVSYLIKNSKGIINLIESDYEQLTKVFPNNKKHYVAPMMEDPKKETNYQNYYLKNRESKNILIGNSATRENHHIEVFNLLEHLKTEDIKIICPLSYGDMNYAKEIIDEGNKIFGNNFCPLTDFMNYEEYIEILSTCSVGIFNNDRQQAMGNINCLLRMGKKLYLRENTAMWNEYKKNNNIKIYSIDELNTVSYSDLYKFDEEDAENNFKNMELRAERFGKAWENLLNEIELRKDVK